MFLGVIVQCLILMSSSDVIPAQTESEYQVGHQSTPTIPLQRLKDGRLLTRHDLADKYQQRHRVLEAGLLRGFQSQREDIRSLQKSLKMELRDLANKMGPNSMDFAQSNLQNLGKGNNETHTSLRSSNKRLHPASLTEDMASLNKMLKQRQQQTAQGLLTALGKRAVLGNFRSYDGSDIYSPKVFIPDRLTTAKQNQITSKESLSVDFPGADKAGSQQFAALSLLIGDDHSQSTMSSPRSLGKEAAPSISAAKRRASLSFGIAMEYLSAMLTERRRKHSATSVLQQLGAIGK